MAANAERTVVIAVRTEGDTLAAKSLTNVGTNVIPADPFNAGLIVKDYHDEPHPYLAQELPKLNTDSWRVLPDGRMETTYQLKPNLHWHDGAVLAADDFVFGWRVYSAPEVSYSAISAPMNQIEEVAAPDARTVLIRWKNTYAGAAELQANDLQSLPRHLLEQPFQQLGPDAFVAHPFWTTDFVGSGAYRVTEWQRGVFLLSDAFDNFVLGKPRITRMKMVPIADPNTVLANLLAGEIHVAVSNSLPETEGFALKHEWERRGGGGVVSMVPSASAASIRRTENQFSPDKANPRFIMDVRVRRALAHTVDKQGINDALFEGTGLMMDTIVPRNLAFFDELNRQVTKYPYDPRRADQLMTEAGLTKGSDGYYLGPSGERLNWDIKVLSGSQNEAIMHIMADSWRRVGFDMTETVYPVAQINDREARASFRTMFSTDGGNIEALGTAGIPTPQNRFVGSNRGSWSNPDFDRLVTQWEGTLDRNERGQRMIEMATIYSDDLPSTPIYVHPTVTPYPINLTNVADGVRDIHLWEWVS